MLIHFKILVVSQVTCLLKYCPDIIELNASEHTQKKKKMPLIYDVDFLSSTVALGASVKVGKWQIDVGGASQSAGRESSVFFGGGESKTFHALHHIVKKHT